MATPLPLPNANEAPTTYAFLPSSSRSAAACTTNQPSVGVGQTGAGERDVEGGAFAGDPATTAYPNVTPPSVATWSMFHQPALLETRVRLLVDRDPTAVSWDRIAGRLLLVAAGVITGAWLSGFPVALHRLTELLIAVLP